MKAWENTFEMPLEGRSVKPREVGHTMVIDKGIGLRQSKDLAEMAADYVDEVKFTFGTSAFYGMDITKEKIKIFTDAGIEVMPGGTFLEVSVWQKSYKQYLERAAELGFTTIEVSDGTIDIDLEQRKDLIKQALDAGFKVITEVGKKKPEEKPAMDLMREEILQDLENGASKVIVEARAAGKGVGIFDKSGNIIEDEINEIVSGGVNQEDLIWEAPIKSQQQYLILRYGPNVGLGNIPPEDILALEALRNGLRGDTLKRAYNQNKNWE